MKKLNSLPLFLKGLVLLPLTIGAASALAASPMLNEGTQEIGLDGTLDFEYVDDFLIDINGSYGYFIQDNLEVGGVVGFTMSDNVEEYTAGAFAEYNFTTGTQWVPYVGAAAEYAYASVANEDESAFNFQVAGGVKYFIHPQVAFNVEVNYNMATEDIYVNENLEAQSDETNIIFGTSFYY